MLTFTEDLFLVTIYERKNSIVSSPVPAIPYALIGAMVVDLLSAEKLRLVEEKRIQLADAASTGTPYLDFLLNTIQLSPKSKKLTYWITTFGGRYKKLQRLMIESLIAKGYLAVGEEQYNWVVPLSEEPHRSGSIKFQRKQRLREIILGGDAADERSTITLYLLNTFGLLDCLFTPDEIKGATRKVKDLLKDETSASPLFRQIDEISTAAAIASAMGGPV